MKFMTNVLAFMTLLILLCLQQTCADRSEAPGVEIEPLWDIDSNATQPCAISNSAINNETSTLHGSLYGTCSIHVTSYLKINIIIPSTYEDDFVFVDMSSNCTQKFVAVYGENETCSFTIGVKDFQLNLLSNTNISMWEINSTSSRDESRESVDDKMDPENWGYSYLEMSRCAHLKEYKNVFECLNEQNVEGFCRFLLPSNCNASISNHEAVLQCDDVSLDKSGSVLLAYHVQHTKKLFMTFSNIFSIEVNTFSDLKYLEELHLHNNKIKELEPGVFNGMSDLKLLSLLLNQLSSLDRAVFRGLNKLETLNLAGNNLNTIPRDLIQDLVSLKSFEIASNKLIAIDGTFFHGLKELHKISSNNNHLTSLPNELFHGLENLQTVLISENHELEAVPSSLFNESKNIRALYLFNNKLKSIPDTLFQGLQKLEILTVHGNPIPMIGAGIFQGLASLKSLSLATCKLSVLPHNIFWGLGNLSVLDLKNNSFSRIPDGIFDGLHNLKHLTMHFNQIQTLPPKLFDDLEKLTLLRLNGNLLSVLPANLFKNLGQISFLDISHNRFLEIPVPTYILSHLKIFALSHNPFKRFDKNMLFGLTNETNLLASQNEICECFAPDDVSCSSEDQRSPYLTCNRLLSDRFLVVAMWLIGLLSITGNVFVIVWKQRKLGENKVQSVLLTNLAISDFLMGVYMIIIACADIYYGDDFPMQSEAWRSGVTCRIAGTLAILSSEASVFFVSLISIDRFLHISFPFSNRKFNRKSVVIASVLTWVFALVLSIIPNLLAGQNFKFYDNSHVCIGFPLALLEIFSKHPIDPVVWEGITFLFFSSYSVSEGLTTGLYYSIALFLGLNCVCYLIILGCYIKIILVVRASSRRLKRSQDMNMQIKMTIKVTAIVATDFLCWFPIIILGVLVQARAITLQLSVFAWLVTCVLPINSAVNPYLYTISEVIAKWQKKSDHATMRTQSFSLASQKRVSSVSESIKR